MCGRAAARARLIISQPAARIAHFSIAPCCCPQQQLTAPRTNDDGIAVIAYKPRTFEVGSEPGTAMSAPLATASTPLIPLTCVILAGIMEGVEMLEQCCIRLMQIRCDETHGCR